MKRLAYYSTIPCEPTSGGPLQFYRHFRERDDYFFADLGVHPSILPGALHNVLPGLDGPWVGSAARAFSLGCWLPLTSSMWARRPDEWPLLPELSAATPL